MQRQHRLPTTAYLSRCVGDVLSGVKLRSGIGRLRQVTLAAGPRHGNEAGARCRRSLIYYAGTILLTRLMGGRREEHCFYKYLLRSSLT
ncbi:hypothetical protein E2C01_037661 [Portunus trituberculatus]|uniref:Uncharacterized protein n=1 Tax=Portunus trituberculatus TaxID=210409 RepID=A0A5B7FC15_PORTR|nr:hypothetical protein [Portunus trituberculatus]